MFKKVNRSLSTLIVYFRNAVLVISVFITIFYLFAYFMNKDTIKLDLNVAYDQNRHEMYDMVLDTKYQESDISKLQMNVYRSLLCYTFGETCTDNPDEAQQYIDESLITKASNIFVAPFANPPASGVIWAYESMEQSGFIPESYAQGIGFYALQPLAPIWKIFRNISYMILVLIVVAIGFMIMFRGHINPQAVISIENTIPRIILALILITFSFPIAGFMIDIMYLLMGLGGSVIIENLASTSGRNVSDVIDAVGWQEDIFNSTGWGLFDNMLRNGNIWKTGSALLSLVPFELQLIFRLLMGSIVMLVISNHHTVDKFLRGDFADGIPIIKDIVNLGISPVVTGLVFGLIVGILFPLILSFFVFVTTLFLFFRIFFLLFLTYTRIILSVIFSPIILIFEAFPERNTFTYWIKGLFFNLLTFPIVAVLLLTSGMIANLSSTGYVYADPEWANWNPETGSSELWRPPFLYSIEAEGFIMLLAVSIIFLIPDIVAFIKKSFGVEDLPFSISPGKLLGGAGVSIAGGSGLFMRARSIAREFGVYRDNPAASNWGIFKNILPEDSSKALAEALKDRQSKDNTPP